VPNGPGKYIFDTGNVQTGTYMLEERLYDNHDDDDEVQLVPQWKARDIHSAADEKSSELVQEDEDAALQDDSKDQSEFVVDERGQTTPVKAESPEVLHEIIPDVPGEHAGSPRNIDDSPRDVTQDDTEEKEEHEEEEESDPEED